MAFKVKALRKCFVNNTLREAGEEFTYDGPENKNLLVIEEVQTPAKAAKAAKPASKKDKA